MKSPLVSFGKLVFLQAGFRCRAELPNGEWQQSDGNDRK